jgi:hypothetical protein
MKINKKTCIFLFERRKEKKMARVEISSRKPDKWPDDCLHVTTHDLAVRNQFPHDTRIQFDEEPHIYYVDGKAMPISSTAICSALFDPFDAMLVAGNMKPESKAATYGNMTDEEIVASWKKKGNDASTTGTKVHAAIEVFLNTGFITRDSSIRPHINMFLNFYKADFLRKMNLEPVRTELLVFAPNDNPVMSGSIDLLARSRKTGEFMILDWKCTGGDLSASFGKVCNVPWLRQFRIPDSKLGHYSLQLHLYRHVVMKSHNFPFIPVSNLFLVVLHPDNAGYKVIPCLDLSACIPIMFEHMDEIIAINNERKAAGKH